MMEKWKRIILLVGFFFMFFAVIVLAAPGGLDTTFGTGGIATYNSPSNNDDWAAGVAVQNDGKIVVVGTTFNGANFDVIILRYNKNGTLDTSFGTGGVVIYNSPANDDDEGQGVTIQRDGKIVVAFHFYNGQNWDLGVLRYNKNGTLDTTFGTGGVFTYNSPSSGNDEGHGVAIQQDGKIVVLGDSWGTFWDIIILRLNKNGTLDTNFGTGGVVRYNGPANSHDWIPENGNSLAIQKDGKIVVVGSYFNWINWNVLFLRYNSDGTIDDTFGTGGVVTYNGPPNCDDFGNGVALQQDGKIVVVGDSFNCTNWDGLGLRYNSDGTLDNTFGTGGVVIYNSQVNGDDSNYGVAIQKDGRIIAVGETFHGATGYNVLVLRYNSNGVLDPNFGTGGVVTYNGQGFGGDWAETVSIQRDGKIVVVGGTTNGIYDDVLVLRLLGK